MSYSVFLNTVVCCSSKQLRPWVPLSHLNSQSSIRCGISICCIRRHSQEHSPTLRLFTDRVIIDLGEIKRNSSKFSFSKWQVGAGASFGTVFDKKNKCCLNLCLLYSRPLRVTCVHLGPTDTLSFIFLAPSSKVLNFTYLLFRRGADI